MLDPANQQFHLVSQKNRMKIQPVNDQLNDHEKIQNKQRQQ